MMFPFPDSSWKQNKNHSCGPVSGPKIPQGVPDGKISSLNTRTEILISLLEASQDDLSSSLTLTKLHM